MNSRGEYPEEQEAVKTQPLEVGRPQHRQRLQLQRVEEPGRLLLRVGHLQPFHLETTNYFQVLDLMGQRAFVLEAER